MNFPLSHGVDNNSKGNVLAPLWDLKDLTRKENKGFEFLAKACIWIDTLVRNAEDTMMIFFAVLFPCLTKMVRFGKKWFLSYHTLSHNPKGIGTLFS